MNLNCLLRMASFDAKFHWSLELEEKLVMFVMDYPCIFDPKVVEYRNAEVKANAFVKISKSIGCGEFHLMFNSMSLFTNRQTLCYFPDRS